MGVTQVQFHNICMYQLLTSTCTKEVRVLKKKKKKKKKKKLPKSPTSLEYGKKKKKKKKKSKLKQNIWKAKMFGN